MPSFSHAFARRLAPRRSTVAVAAVLVLGLLASGTASGDEALRQGQQPDVDPALRAALARAVAASDSFEHRFDAEVWLTDMSSRLQVRIPDEDKRLDLLRMVHSEATRADLPPEMVLAVIQVESNFDRFAISTAGALGLMQIMPFWLDELGRPDDNLFDVATNLRYGCTILAHYLKIANGRWHEALARYNGSFGQYWYPDRVFTALERRWYRR